MGQDLTKATQIFSVLNPYNYSFSISTTVAAGATDQEHQLCSPSLYAPFRP